MTSHTANLACEPQTATHFTNDRQRTNRGSIELLGILARTLFAAAVMFSGTLLSPTPAAAHAELLNVTPSDGASVTSSPSLISLTFNEPVTGAPGSVQLIDANAKVLRRSAAVTGSTVNLPGKPLPKGRYLIRWSVASADGHIIVGATSFALKTPTVKSSPVSILLSGTSGKLVVKLSGSKPGVRTLSVAGVRGEGTVELRTTKFGAPLQWKFTSVDNLYKATGVIPAPGVWEVTVRLRTSTFEQSVYTGTVTIKK
jgi:methionine-rich copper-binding protein CopC